MPIYEFYCPDCNTVFSFLSATVDTTKQPDCPRCGRARLARRPSRFAALRGATAGAEAEDEHEPSPFGDLDESRLEGAMESLAQEMGELGDADAEDPRRLARFFRKFSQASGLEAGPRMEEMLRRLESGEDPDALEDEMGDLGEGGEESMEDFFRLKKQAQALRRRRPKVDETLYSL